MKCKHRAVVSAAAVSVLSSSVLGATIGTKTITNANHYGYFGFASTSANNTKTIVGPFSGTVRTIRVEGTLTKVHPDAWASSLRVHPSGAALAGYQPWFQFSNQRAFTGTIPVSATIYAPGGFNATSSLNFEMFSIDSEGFVPGLDGTSTLTYTFDDAFPAGTAEYNGALTTSDPTFNRPIQFPSSAPSGYTAPLLSGQMPYYDVQPFHVATAGSYALVSANEFESAGVLYQGNFNPASPLTNCVWALSQTGNVIRNRTFNDLPFNDDATGGTLINANLVPGVQYYFVTSAYAAPGAVSDGGPFVGRYSNIITGAGDVSLGFVPEPGVGITAASLAILTLQRRRKQQ